MKKENKVLPIIMLCAIFVSLSMMHVNGLQLASGGSSGKVKLWDVHRGKLLQEFNHGESVLSVAFRPDLEESVAEDEWSERSELIHKIGKGFRKRIIIKPKEFEFGEEAREIQAPASFVGK